MSKYTTFTMLTKDLSEDYKFSKKLVEHRATLYMEHSDYRLSDRIEQLETALRKWHGDKDFDLNTGPTER